MTANGIQPLQTASIQKGQAVFSKLEKGLYLLVQTTPSNGNRRVRSFLMSVPDADGKLDVVAKPKPGAWDGKKTSSTKTTSAKTTGATTGGTSSICSRVPATDDRLPSLVPPAAAGIVLAAIGVCGRRAGRTS